MTDDKAWAKVEEDLRTMQHWKSVGRREAFTDVAVWVGLVAVIAVFVATARAVAGWP